MQVGARAVREAVLDPHPSSVVQVFFVWIRMFPIGTLEAAQSAAGQFSSYENVQQFYDPRQLVGLEIAEGMGGEAGDVAWDIYLFYAGIQEWSDRMPLPIDWAHQLPDSSWAPAQHLHRGEQLKVKLGNIMGELLSGE
jgi:hypothetical protein